MGSLILLRTVNPGSQTIVSKLQCLVNKERLRDRVGGGLSRLMVAEEGPAPCLAVLGVSVTERAIRLRAVLSIICVHS
jgi:hypothetical protein